MSAEELRAPAFGESTHGLLALGALGVVARLERELPERGAAPLRAPKAIELAALGAIALLLRTRRWLESGAQPLAEAHAAPLARPPEGWLR